MKQGIYEISVTRKFLFLLKGILLAVVVGYLFYESIWGMVLLTPCVPIIYIRSKKQEKMRKKNQLNQQFLDALNAISSALSVGYSLENSIGETVKELVCIYGEDEMIVKEFRWMDQQIHLNKPLEETFFQFSERASIEDITNFAWILFSGKRTGGDILKVVRSTSQIIRDKIEVEREIETVITSKKLESTIMNLVPAGIIVYLKLGCSDFITPLYHNTQGILLMTGVLVGYFISYLISCKLVQIEV